MVKFIKTFDAQQLACKAFLDNFAINTWPDDYTKELKLLLKWW